MLYSLVNVVEPLGSYSMFAARYPSKIQASLSSGCSLSQNQIQTSRRRSNFTVMKMILFWSWMQSI